MRLDTQQYLYEYPELRQFIRRHPVWYRKLSRDPSRIYELEKEANYFYGRTFPQRVEQIQNHLSLAMMMIEMMRMSQETVTEAVV